jgi:hypothetical protein
MTPMTPDATLVTWCGHIVGRKPPMFQGTHFVHPCGELMSLADLARAMANGGMCHRCGHEIQPGEGEVEMTQKEVDEFIAAREKFLRGRPVDTSDSVCIMGPRQQKGRAQTKFEQFLVEIIARLLNQEYEQARDWLLAEYHRGRTARAVVKELKGGAD